MSGDRCQCSLFCIFVGKLSETNGLCLFLVSFSFDLLGVEEGGVRYKEINSVLDCNRDELGVGEVGGGCFREVAIECMIF